VHRCPAIRPQHRRRWLDHARSSGGLLPGTWIPPERKYQQEGGPLLRDCIGLLREWSTVAALDIRDFLDGLIFNVLIGNADAHGKNYSILYRGTERRLAPFYDLVCTLAWPELSKTPAMKIGKSDSIERITPAHWQTMAQESRVGWPMLRERIANLCGKVIEALQNKDLPAATNDLTTAERVAGIIAFKEPEINTRDQANNASARRDIGPSQK